MPNISELTGSTSGIASTLKDGVDQISGGQSIVFAPYKRTVLPADGYVFLLADSDRQPVEVAGSLHYDTKFEVRSDEQIGASRVVFTAESPVQAFSGAGSNAAVWIGTVDGVRFAFSERSPYYQQSGLHHYVGESIAPAMYDMVVDDPASFDVSRLIAANSLPIWLAFAQTAGVPLFPAFLSPANEVPPYGTVDISTRPLQAVAYVDAQSNHQQLMADKCKFTFYGLGNDAALRFVDAAVQFCLEDNVGLMNLPAINDDHRVSHGLGAIATKKTVEFEISYYQTYAQNVARQLILQVTDPNIQAVDTASQ